MLSYLKGVCVIYYRIITLCYPLNFHIHQQLWMESWQRMNFRRTSVLLTKHEPANVRVLCYFSIIRQQMWFLSLFELWSQPFKVQRRCLENILLFKPTYHRLHFSFFNPSNKVNKRTSPFWSEPRITPPVLSSPPPFATNICGGFFSPPSLPSYLTCVLLVQLT